jgi:hypothetical protein
VITAGVGIGSPWPATYKLAGSTRRRQSGGGSERGSFDERRAGVSVGDAGGERRGPGTRAALATCLPPCLAGAAAYAISTVESSGYSSSSTSAASPTLAS